MGIASNKNRITCAKANVHDFQMSYWQLAENLNEQLGINAMQFATADYIMGATAILSYFTADSTIFHYNIVIICIILIYNFTPISTHDYHQRQL